MGKEKWQEKARGSTISAWPSSSEEAGDAGLSDEMGAACEAIAVQSMSQRLMNITLRRRVVALAQKKSGLTFPLGYSRGRWSERLAPKSHVVR
jgi:hypothetical protein